MPPTTDRSATHSRSLLLLALAVMLSMSAWFSASAVIPQLIRALSIGPTAQSMMTVSVQLGFVLGALVSALLTLPDRLPTQRLIAACAGLAALSNAAIAWLEPGVNGVLALRFITGMMLAGVYPPAMKLVVTYTRTNRGLWVGLLVGALTIGSALPHAINALGVHSGGMPPWPGVLLAASVLTAVGGVLVLLLGEGPHALPRAVFDWQAVPRLLRDRPLRLVNLGYLGHMWELYAMWAWAPILLLASFESAGWSPVTARWSGFAVIAVGALGAWMAGAWADRWGRTRVTIASLVVSGGCALLAGALFAHPGWLLALCLLWGFAVVADSAQFSTAVTELAEPRYTGTALTLQTLLGFALTSITIHSVPWLIGMGGWTLATASLAIGPAVGVLAMWRLRQLPEALKMAGGQR